MWSLQSLLRRGAGLAREVGVMSEAGVLTMLLLGGEVSLGCSVGGVCFMSCAGDNSSQGLWIGKEL